MEDNKETMQSQQGQPDTLLSRPIIPAQVSGDTPFLKSTELPNKQKCLAKVKNMLEKREAYVKRWKAIRDYQLPFIGEFDDTADKTDPARRRDLKIAQGVSWLSCQVFGAGIMSGLTPPSREWFKYSFSSSSFAEDVDAAKVLDIRKEITSSVLIKSNFYNAIHAAYMELPFGQACVGVFPDPKTGVRFTNFTVGSYCLATGSNGRVNTFSRKFEMTAYQMAEQFGKEHLSNIAKNALKSDEGHTKKFEVYWLVEPNDDITPGKLGRLNMPYRSIYWEANSASSEFLYVGGCEEFPCPAGRYMVTGTEPYGKGPGWFAEGDAKSLQLMRKDYLTALELSVKPPMQAPTDLIMQGVNLIPGGMTPVANPQSGVKPIFEVGVNMDHLSQEIVRVSDDIKRAYSADLFLMMDNIPNTHQMTAAEVTARQNEKLTQLGPVTERLQEEFLNPIIERVYNILDRAGYFPPIDEEIAQRLADQDVKIEYISPLAQAQKMSGLVNIEQGVAFAGQMAQLDPNALKELDVPATVRKYFELLGAPAEMRRSKKEIQAMMEQEQAAMQQAQQEQSMMQSAQMAAPAAAAAKNLTEAANDGNPALAQLLGMGQG